MNADDLTQTERRAFVIFLKMELRRHLKDVRQIRKDLANIHKYYGIDIDVLPDYGFVEVSERKV